MKKASSTLSESEEIWIMEIERRWSRESELFNSPSELLPCPTEVSYPPVSSVHIEWSKDVSAGKISRGVVDVGDVRA